MQSTKGSKKITGEATVLEQTVVGKGSPAATIHELLIASSKHRQRLSCPAALLLQIFFLTAISVQLHLP